MAKSNNLFGILFIGVVLICGSAGSFSVKKQSQEQRIRSQEQRIRSQEQRSRSQDFSRVKDISREGRKGSQEQRTKIKDFHKAQSGNRGQKGSQEQRAKIKDFSRVNLGSGAFDGISREGRTARVKKIYDSQVGVREQGTNGGPQVEKYLRYVNLSKGNPWCAAFVCWVFGQAEVGNPKSGWSPNLFPASKIIWERGAGTRNKEQRFPPGALREEGTRIKEQRLLAGALREEGTRIKKQRLLAGALREEGTKIKEQRFPPSAPYVYPAGLATCLPARQAGNPQLGTPTTGDVFALYFPEKKRIAHVGFIDSWDGSWLITVEGNTNLAGNREGDGVYRKRRLVRSIYRVARYLY